MIVIKKRVSLDFLGDEYSDSYLVFRGIAVREYPELMKRTQQLGEDGAKSIELIRTELTERFIEGKVKVDGSLVEVTKEDLADLTADVFLVCYQTIAGTPDPKA